MALENSQEIIGHVIFVLDEAKNQPLGYRFKPVDGEYGPLHPTIADTLHDRFGQVQLTIEAVAGV